MSAKRKNSTIFYAVAGVVPWLYLEIAFQHQDEISVDLITQKHLPIFPHASIVKIHTVPTTFALHVVITKAGLTKLVKVKNNRPSPQLTTRPR